MSAELTPAKMAPMDDDRVERGAKIQQAVKDRRPQGLKAAWLIRFTGISRTTYDNAIRGVASLSTYEALEAALEDWDQNPGEREAAPAVLEHADGLIEVELGGVRNDRFSAERLIFRGPRDSVDELVEAVQKILNQVTDADDETNA